MTRRVLLVEDESAVAEYLSTFLEQEGFEVIQAGSLKSARSRIVEPFDLFMLDLNLPDGTGDQLLPSIRQQHPRTPVLMVTGAAADDERVLQALRSGASGCVNKSARIDEIVRHLRNALAN